MAADYRGPSGGLDTTGNVRELCCCEHAAGCVDVIRIHVEVWARVRGVGGASSAGQMPQVKRQGIKRSVVFGKKIHGV